MTVKKCEICGQEYEALHSRCRFCKACRNQAYLEKSRLYRKNKRKQERQPKPQPTMTIEDMVEKADKLGVTYGQLELMMRRGEQ